MDLRNKINSGLTFFWTYSLCGLIPLFAQTTFQRPNIILILADDLGYETLSANGGESYATPVLDGLAKSGARFTQAFANPVCTPTRVKLMTGKINLRNYTSFGALDNGEITFANQLKAAGYATAITGKWQLGESPTAPQQFGFDEALLWQHVQSDQFRTDAPYIGKKIDSRYPNPELVRNGKKEWYYKGEYGPQLLTDFALNFIEKNAKNSFFLYYPMVLTHAPFDPTPDSKLWDPKRMGSATINGDLGNIQENFADMMKYMDQDMGKIVHKLDSLGIRENTLMLFMGDNGTAASIKSKWSGLQIQGGKYTLNDNGVRVPFLVSWPKYIKEGFVSPELVDAADIFPTLMQAAKVNLPLNYTHDGRSLLSTLLRQPGRSKEFVSVEDGKKDRMVRTLNYSWSLIGTSYEFRYHPGTLQPTTLLDINKLTADQQKVWAFLKTKMTENTNFSASKTPFPPDTHKVNYPPPVGVAIYNSRVGTKNTDGLEIRLNKKDKNSLEIWVPRLTTGNLVLTLYSSSGRVVYKARKTALPVEVQGRAYSQINWNKASNIGMPLGKGRYLISVTNTDHVGGQKAANWRTSIDL